MIRIAAAYLLTALALPAAAFVPQAPNGAAITAQKTDPVSSHGIAVGPAPVLSSPPWLRMEGVQDRTAWHSGTHPAAALMVDLVAQLEAAGFDAVFDCAMAACGGFDFRIALPLLDMPDMFVSLGGFEYRAFKRAAPPALASVLTSQTPAGAYAQLSVITPPKPQNVPPSPVASEAAPTALSDTASVPPGTPTRLATSIVEEIETEGRVVLPDLAFASGAAALSGPPPAALADLAAWLAADAARRIALVGHTDWTGAPSANTSLSRARAQTVADALVAAGAVSSQITVAGAGPFAPIAENDTEAGRAKNRRVEAVALPPAR
ncbi:OmpA family protein [Meridianimarinicoccus aquatilis]|uniref:OmpA family protein n=1 Tax=Meridianimarinicoccus aquatilis TaxID=2552766 RepID=A0A4R6B1V2_9RHOB|nr:OmpA family protein [Fluviibacterium aquatile]TDL89218.1 OmpA family protein [Fluviibacterium aquatile]